MSKIKVSVIIPVYNTARYLTRCLDSVINQTLKEIEIICVDSNSTDNSLEVLEKYKRKDSRIKVFHLQTKPASISRNYGLKVAKGEYIAFVDSDDYVDKKEMERTYRESIKNDADVCCWKFDKISNKKIIYSKRVYFNGLIDIDYDNLFFVSEPCVWNKLYKHKFLCENNISFIANSKSEDIYFSYLVLSCAKRIVTLNEVLYYYCLRDNCITSDVNYHPYDFCISLIELKKELKRRGKYKVLYKAYANLVKAILSFEFNNNIKKMNYKDIKSFVDTINNQYRMEIVDKYNEKLLNESIVFKEYLNYINIKKSKPEVSIIVPIHNTQKYLEKCLVSLQSQTLNNIEILCIDSSTDNSKKIIEHFCNNDTRFKYIYDENSSYGHKINLGIELSKGKYIGIVDSDDFVDEDAYYSYYKAIKKYKCDFVKYNAKCVEEIQDKYVISAMINATYDKTLFDKSVNFKHNIEIVYKDQGNIWSSLYSKKFLTDNFIKLNESSGASYQDTSFCVLTTLLANKIYYINDSYYNYRINRNDSSVHDNSKYLCVCNEYEYVQKFIKSRNFCFSKKQMDAIDVKFMLAYNWNFFRLSNGYDLKFINKINDFIKCISNNYFFSIFNDLEKQRYNELIHGKDLINNKISIIVPVFNQEKYIFQCLDSILNQRYKNIEIIIVNDGSSDGSLKIIKEYKKNNKEIRIVNIKHSGLSYARNIGIKKSIGEYILFLDSDDLLSCNAISMLLCKAIDNKSDLVVYDTNCLFEEDVEYNQKMVDYCTRYKSYGLQNSNVLFTKLQNNNDIADMSFLHFVKRDWLVKNKLFFKENIFYEDSELLPRLYFAADKIYHTNERYYTYRIRKNSITNSKYNSYKLISKLKCHMSMLELINSNNLDYDTLLALIDRDKSLVGVITSSIKYLDFSEAMKVLDYDLTGFEIDQLVLIGFKYTYFYNLRTIFQKLKKTIVVVGNDSDAKQMMKFIKTSSKDIEIVHKTTRDFSIEYKMYMNKSCYCYICKQSEVELDIPRIDKYKNVHIINNLDINSIDLYFSYCDKGKKE